MQCAMQMRLVQLWISVGDLEQWYYTFFGVNMILDGMLQVGTLIAFGTYISMFWRPVMNLSNFYNQLVTNIAGAERNF